MATAQEAALHYPLGDALPPPGGWLEVAPGVRWVRMRLPFALDHINLWLLADRDAQGRDGWAIVDCGIDNAETRAMWEQVFAGDALQGRPVLRVIVTHMHPDHIGLAHWLTARWSSPASECRLWISATDWNAARMASGGAGGAAGGDGAARFFALHGLVEPSALEQIRARSSYYPGLVPAVPQRFRRLMDGQQVTVGDHAWRCIAGYGHAPEHIALHAPGLGDGGVLISGDMVLPRISTNVSVYDLEPESDPLALYLASIARLRELPPATLVLPSHGRPFTGLHGRAAPPNCCRCCSAARWTSTRPPSRWASPWPTCTCWHRPAASLPRTAAMGCGAGGPGASNPVSSFAPPERASRRCGGPVVQRFPAGPGPPPAVARIAESTTTFASEAAATPATFRRGPKTIGAGVLTRRHSPRADPAFDLPALG
jgi:glyoxylase-like metal-dependent hydrolase (beta-lactamase superfamily II)